MIKKSICVILGGCLVLGIVGCGKTEEEEFLDSIQEEMEMSEGDTEQSVSEDIHLVNVSDEIVLIRMSMQMLWFSGGEDTMVLLQPIQHSITEKHMIV